MTPYERMTRGLVYDPNDREIMDEQLPCLDALLEFNATRLTEETKRQELMKKMFAEVGEGCFIQPPFYANWGGRHIHLGNFVYANFNLTAVNDAEIFIGDRTMIGPNVTLATAAHPIRCDLRERALQYNRPVHIGRNVWLGAGVIVLPGVSIGDGSVVGAGSVVTKDIPAGVVAVGSPCRVLRPIGEHDREFYNHDCRFDGEE